MSAEEFGLWLAYRQVNPFGPLLHPLAAALAEVLTAAANGALQRKDGRLWRSADFMPADPWAPPKAPPHGPAAAPAGPSLEDIGNFFGKLSGG